LQIPATSAPSERFFSHGALIINKLRNRLNKDSFEKIICLKNWGIIKSEEDISQEIKDEEFEKENIFVI
jgi:hypothetical protein